MTRRVVRFMLRGDEWNRERLLDFADMLEKEATKGSRTMPADHKIRLARALTAIAQGAKAEQVLGIGRSRGGQYATERHKFLALDYWLSRRLDPRAPKTYAQVAVRWNEDSEDTVKGIARRHRRHCQNFLDSVQEPLVLYADAVAAARVEILTGQQAPIDIAPDEVIDVVCDWSPVLGRF